MFFEIILSESNLFHIPNQKNEIKALIFISMKSPISLFACLSLFLLFSVSLQQILPNCILEQGCISNITNLRAHLPISDHPPFEFKNTQWILLFADKLVLTFENNTIKSMSYGEIPLDCGPENNKFCTVSEYQAKFPEQMVGKGEFTKNVCFVLPSIFSEKVSYLCENKGENQLEVLDRVNVLARLIDNYQIKMIKDTENPLNRFPRRHHNVFYLEDDNKLVLANVKVFHNNIQGFLGERMIFNWELKTLNPVKPINMLSDAMRFHEVNEKQLKPLEMALNHSKNMKNDDCMVVFIQFTPKFLCSKNNHSLHNIKETIGGSLSRINYLKNFDLLFMISKTHKNSMVFNPFMRELTSMRIRISKLEQYDTLFCLKNRKTINEKHCQEAKSRDINDEMYFLSQNSENILAGLQKTKRPTGVFRFKQRPFTPLVSFIQVDPTPSAAIAPSPANEPTDAQLKKSQVFKKKVMENLQKNRKWTISQDERAVGEFKKKSESDPFVTYLGFIRDSSISSIKAQEQKLLNS